MAETTITSIQCRRVFDSRGVETLVVDVSTQKGFGRVAAPLVLSTAVAKAAADALKIPMFRLFCREEAWTLPHLLGNMIGEETHCESETYRDHVRLAAVSL